jgi:predicted PurR-regulated permease PerM
MAEQDTNAASGFAAGARDAWAKRDRTVWTLVGILILTAAGVWAFLRIADALAPFVIGGLLAFILRPIIGLLMKWRFGRGLAVAVTMLVLLGLSIAAAMILLPKLGTEVQLLAKNLPALQSQLQSSIADVTAKTSGLPDSAKQALQSVAKQAAATFTAAMQQITTFILAAGGAALGFGFNVFLGFIICIWLLLGGPDIAKWSVSVLPPTWREDALFMGQSFDRSFGGYIRGTIINVTITFLGCAVGFSLVQLPYAIALAALVGVLDVIPFVGPIIGGGIAIIVGFTVSPTVGVLTAIVVLIVEQSVDSVISPIVMGDSVELHPLGILLALGIGGALAGFFGVLISIPAAAAIYSIYLYFMRKNGVLEPATPKPPKKSKNKAKPARTPA